MARYDFGGTLADFVVTSRRLGGLDVLGLSSATLTFWSAQLGGTRYTDLVLNGSAATSISVGADGQVPKFQGPDGVTEMWADGGSARIRVVTLQGAPGPAGKDGINGANGLPGVNAVANDTATAGYVNSAASATGKALTTATARALGFKIVTDTQWAGGADATGVADSTAAIDAARAAGDSVYFPAGTFAYGGSGLSADTSGKGLVVVGAGRLSTTIVLGAGQSLVTKTTGGPWQLHISGIKTSGGYGAIRFTSTSNSVLGSLVVRDNEFTDYTGAAVSSLNPDQPYWRIENNKFVGANDISTVGVALHGDNAQSLIKGNQFLRNGVHLKLSGTCGGGSAVENNDFIRFTAYTTSPRIDLWIAPPTGSGQGGGGFNASHNKFGSENIDGRDYRVVMAVEDAASNTDRALQKPLLTGPPGTAKGVYGHTYHDNLVGGVSGAAPAFMSIAGIQVQNSTIRNIVWAGTTPANIVAYLQDPGDSNAGSADSGNLIDGIQGVPFTFGDLSGFTPVNYPGLWRFEDQLRRIQDPDTPDLTMAQADAAGFLSLFDSRTGTWSKTGAGVITTGAADVLGGTDAVTFAQAASSDHIYANLTAANLIPGVPVWVQFDAALGSSGPQGLSVQASGASVVRWQVIARLKASGWYRYTFRYVPKSTAGNQIHFGTTNGTAGTFSLGRVRIYRSQKPVNVDGWFPDQVQAAGGVITKVAGHSGAPTDSDVTKATDGQVIATSSGFYGRLGGSWTQLGSAAVSIPSNPFGGFALTVGDETVDRMATTTNSLGLTNGGLRLSYMMARKTETVTQVRVLSGGTAAAATPTHAIIGIYSVDGSGNLTLVGQTADDTTLFAATNTAYTRALQVSFVKTAGQFYAVAWLVTSAATMPSIPGANPFGGNPASEQAIAPRLNGSFGSALTALPASITAGSVGSTTGRGYAVLLP